MSNKVLFLGEANFSFTLSYLHKHSSKESIFVVGTSFESRDVCQRKYGDVTIENIQQIVDMGGKVVHEVDATDIRNTLFNKVDQELKFDEIIFNFPHTGRKAGINLNRKLLKDFFCNCATILSSDGVVEVKLAKGQGGTPFDSVQREHCNSWQVADMASFSGFILTEASLFNESDYPEYSCTGKRNYKACFRTDGAVCHRFRRTTKSPCLSPGWICDMNIYKSSLWLKRLKRWREKDLPQIIVVKTFGVNICKEAQYFNLQKHDCVTKNCEEDVLMHLTCMESALNHGYDSDVQWCHGMSAEINLASDVKYASPLSYVLIMVSKRDVQDMKLNTTKFIRNILNNDNSLEWIENEDGGESMTCSSQQTVFKLAAIMTNQNYSTSTIYIDNLIYLLNPGLNSQLLWTLNTSCRNNILKSLTEKYVFKPPVLHSTKFNHDVSFWLETSHTEKDIHEEMLNLLTQASDFRISSFHLKERFILNDKTSLCYSILYHVQDSAFSSHDSNYVQTCIRELLQENLPIKMR